MQSRRLRRERCLQESLLKAGGAALVCIFVCLMAGEARARASQPQDRSSVDLAHLSLAQLGNVEVTTTTKEPEEVWNTPAAIYVITQADIRRSGATSIPE